MKVKKDVKFLLKILYDELNFNVKLIDKYDRNCKTALSIGNVDTAMFYDRHCRRLEDEIRRIITTINEIEKRVS